MKNTKKEMRLTCYECDGTGSIEEEYWVRVSGDYVYEPCARYVTCETCSGDGTIEVEEE